MFFASFIVQNRENAKIDVLSALYINNKNKEVMSLFTRLFPSKTVAEALSSQLGELVGMALTTIIEEATGEVRGMFSKTFQVVQYLV